MQCRVSPVTASQKGKTILFWPKALDLIQAPECSRVTDFSIKQIQVLNLAWIFVWDRSSVDGYDGLTILAFFILVSIAVSNIAVRMMITIICGKNDTAQVTMMTQITGDDPDGTKHHQVCDRVCPWHPSLLVCFIVWNSYHINIIVISSLSFHCHRNQNHIDPNQKFTQVGGLPFNIIVTILIDCSQHCHLRLLEITFI